MGHTSVLDTSYNCHWTTRKHHLILCLRNDQFATPLIQCVSGCLSSSWLWIPVSGGWIRFEEAVSLLHVGQNVPTSKKSINGWLQVVAPNLTGCIPCLQGSFWESTVLRPKLTYFLAPKKGGRSPEASGLDPDLFNFFSVQGQKATSTDVNWRFRTFRIVLMHTSFVGLRFAQRMTNITGMSFRGSAQSCDTGHIQALWNVTIWSVKDIKILLGKYFLHQCLSSENESHLRTGTNCRKPHYFADRTGFQRRSWCVNCFRLSSKQGNKWQKRSDMRW